MYRPSKRLIRVTLLGFILVSFALVGNSALSANQSASAISPGDSSVPYGATIDLEPRINSSNVSTQPIPENAQLTVVATQGFFVSNENAELTAITRNGTIVYHNSTYKVYFDVDPVQGTEYTVEYVASKQLQGDSCRKFAAKRCTLNVIEQVNLSTGSTERVFAETTPKIKATRWHDADRLNETHLVLADIYRDSVRIINVTSGETTWEWNATNIYDYDGDTKPQDWTHLNDVEVVGNRTFALSMRNMDETVFIRPGDGYLSNRTLGEDDNHQILFEQHNPDYIPEERGGPALIVGDSENNRIVEYQRIDGEWKLTWHWRDSRMQWPRDADRLPNDRTLVADSHGDRVMEISPNGSIAWKVNVGMPYDVERLGTGDESTGGQSTLSMSSSVDGGIHDNRIGRAMIVLKDALPAVWINSLLYVGPAWFRFHDIVVSSLGISMLGIWVVTEYRWASWSIRGLGARVWRRFSE